MKEILTLLLIVALFLLSDGIQAQGNTPSIRQIFAEKRVELSATMEQELSAMYPHDWQRYRIAQFDEGILRAMLVFQYHFQAENEPDLERRQGLASQYMDSIGLPVMLESAVTQEPYQTPEDVQNALNSDELVEVDSQGLTILDRPIQVRQQTADKVETLIEELNQAGVIHVLWATSSVRSEDQNRELYEFGFPVALAQWGISPNSYGAGLTVAIAGTRGTGGAYDRFLEQLDSEALERVAARVEAEQIFPTIDLLISEGVILDQEFLQAYQVLQESDLEVVDLTGFYSVTVHSGMRFELSDINPVISLLDLE